MPQLCLESMDMTCVLQKFLQAQHNRSENEVKFYSVIYFILFYVGENLAKVENRNNELRRQLDDFQWNITRVIGDLSIAQRDLTSVNTKVSTLETDSTAIQSQLASVQRDIATDGSLFLTCSLPIKL